MERDHSGHRYHDRNDQIARIYGKMDIGTLRLTYGQSFGSGLDPNLRLMDALDQLDDMSLESLIGDVVKK
ncbi:hypothetical protein GALL_426530 [mine drainage metagenome]|uniref:Uncharacterized protein n=1 Tax=mine drainage metagenome TaxID=410659 RepID=A0A1J5PXQ0_9ZZZZ